MNIRVAWFCGFAFLAGCAATGDDYGTVASGTSRKTSVGATAASTSGVTTGGSQSASGTSAGATSGASAGTSSGGSTSSSGSTSGSPSINCAEPVGAQGFFGCPTGTVEVLGQLSDYCANTNFMGTATITNLADNQAMANDLACGFFSFCVAPGQPVSALITDDNYFSVLLPTVTPTGNTIIDATPGVAMICSLGQESFQTYLVDPPFDPTLATVLIAVQDDSSGGSTPDGPCHDLAGWVFTLHLPDGGVFDAAEAQVSGTTFGPMATATLEAGTTLFYNLDPALTGLTFTADNPRFDAAGLDAGLDGGLCKNRSESVFKLTPQIPLQGSVLTFIPFSVI